MKQTITTILLTIAAMATIQTVTIDGYTNFQNITTGDNGTSILLKGWLYDALSNKQGGLKDIKVPFTQQTYIVFEVE